MHQEDDSFPTLALEAESTSLAVVPPLDLHGTSKRLEDSIPPPDLYGTSKRLAACGWDPHRKNIWCKCIVSYRCSENGVYMNHE